MSALERTNPNRWEDFGFGSWILDFSFWSLDLGSTVYGLSMAAPELWTYVVYIVWILQNMYSPQQKKCKPCRLGLADSW